MKSHLSSNEIEKTILHMVIIDTFTLFINVLFNISKKYYKKKFTSALSTFYLTIRIIVEENDALSMGEH
jgi:hypothetical protein